MKICKNCGSNPTVVWRTICAPCLRTSQRKVYVVKSLPGEEWKDVVGYEGLYAISNKGRVKILTHYVPDGHGRMRLRQERLMSILKGEYPFVSLYSTNGVMTTKTIHRMQAIAFIPNPENKPEVNHKDGDKWNFALDNLEWNTSKENNNHALRTGLRKITDDHLKKFIDASRCARKKTVAQLDENGFRVAVFSSAREASKSLGKHNGFVSAIIKKKLGLYKGIRFIYVNLTDKVQMEGDVQFGSLEVREF